MVFISEASGRQAASQRAYGAIVLLLLIFLMGGSSRADNASFLLLRPISAFALVFALWNYGAPFWREHRSLAYLTLAVVLVPAIHLVPLPPAIWTALPGRDLVVDVFRENGLALPWQPISMEPLSTLNALLSLMLPISVLLLAVSASRPQQADMMRVILLIGAVSGLLGLLQAIGSPTSPLYFYRITNNGMAVGLFANRNHQAIFLACLIPLISAHLSLISGRNETVRLLKASSAAAAIFLIPLILVTGSRTGLLLTLLAIPLSLWIYREPVVVGRRIDLSSARRLSLFAYSVVGLLMLGLLTLASFRAPAVSRLLASDAAGDLRWTALPTLLKATGDLIPFGSGVGSFVPIYKVYEPRDLLSPNYFNHAHNDYVEVLLTVGLPGALLILVAGFMLFRAAIRAAKPSVALAASREDLLLLRAGVAVLVLLAIASVGDYPLRTPSIAALGAVATAWIVGALRRTRPQ